MTDIIIMLAGYYCLIGAMHGLYLLAFDRYFQTIIKVSLPDGLGYWVCCVVFWPVYLVAYIVRRG